MQLQLSEWDKDLPADPEEEYEALVRSLSWSDGFGLIFVRCSPAEAERLIVRVKKDVREKNIEVLRLKNPIDNFYEIVDSLENKEKIDILFVTGLEYSLYGYEELYKETKLKDSRERYGYSLKGVPRVLGHLNLRRENFRDNFNICFVFILPRFGLKYFIRRAPDFFDWRSGVFEFPTDGELLEKESVRIIQEGDYEKYRNLTPQERSQKILEIEDLLAEENQTLSNRGDLLFELGRVFAAGEEYEEAIASFDRALAIKPDDDAAWNNRGFALYNLGRYEEAIASYDRSLAIKPDNDGAWNYRGIALGNLGRYEEAIASYDCALAIKSDDHYAWHNRGISLKKIGRYEEALASYKKAQKSDVNCHSCWNDMGFVLKQLGRDEEAILSFEEAFKINTDKAEIKPDDEAWYNRGIALGNLGRYEEAIASFDRALDIKPDDHYAWHNKGISLKAIGRYEEALASYREAEKSDVNCLGCYNDIGFVLKQLGRDEEAIASFEEAWKINPDKNEDWYKRGFALHNLGRLEEAIASYDQALKFKPDDHLAWWNRGVALRKLRRIKQAIECFNKVAEIKPEFFQAQLKGQLNQIRTTIMQKLGCQKLSQILKSCLNLIGLTR
ncbi:tetratricopeptide repeat protein [Argonema galeatum]|uniref:tetratricopeptide repeat protein n=1 Tax=Argonema galeatum TaxID=2942762 RepID=UPI002011CB15|nr:tetratricopeptide repeat protein [Argonema galeatum]MCL1466759.1 tetratricopeptide repeat protein [Argonema galeatum A003/A1]